jgi:hypothetical protein
MTRWRGVDASGLDLGLDPPGLGFFLFFILINRGAQYSTAYVDHD